MENGRGVGLVANSDRLAGIGAIMKINVRLIRQGPPDRFANHGLVIDQQDHHMIILRMSRAFGLRVRVKTWAFFRHAFWQGRLTILPGADRSYRAPALPSRHAIPQRLWAFHKPRCSPRPGQWYDARVA